MAKPEGSEKDGGARLARRGGERGKKPSKASPATPEAGSVGWALEWARSLAVAFIIFLVLRTFLVQTFVITSGSMEDTLLVGDFLVISRAAYGTRIPGTEHRTPGYQDIERGHVIVFRPPHDPDIDVVKRVVGLAGDTLAMRGKVLMLNGEPLPEPYTRHSDPEGDVRDAWMDWQLPFLIPGARPEGFRPSRDEWGPFVVPEGRLFLLGDNRDDSIDSRYWGFLDRRQVKGRSHWIYFSYDAESLRPFPWIRDVRWGRLFRGIR